MAKTPVMFTEARELDVSVLIGVLVTFEALLTARTKFSLARALLVRAHNRGQFPNPGSVPAELRCLAFGLRTSAASLKSAMNKLAYHKATGMLSHEFPHGTKVFIVIDQFKALEVSVQVLKATVDSGKLRVWLDNVFEMTLTAKGKLDHGEDGGSLKSQVDDLCMSCASMVVAAEYIAEQSSAALAQIQAMMSRMHVV